MILMQGVHRGLDLPRAIKLQIIGSARRILSRAQSHSISRLSSNTTSRKEILTKPAAKFPERLLIYHAGTGRTVFIGCLKVTTIFVFGFFCLVVTPSHFYAPEEPAWIAGAVLLSGLIPLAFVSYTTAPFVNYIHLRLPHFARHSRENLLRYSRELPRDAIVEITTMNAIGKPRVDRVEVGNLYPARTRFSLANYTRSLTAKETQRPWWAGKQTKKFAVLGGFGQVREEGVWQNVASAIEKFHKAPSEV